MVTTVLTPPIRSISYTDDGLQRLTGAVESPGSSFAYSYDLMGNRTGITVDGTAVLTNTYDAAEQVVGWTYDNAGSIVETGGATGSEGGATVTGCCCFAGDTGVATPHGLTAIASLKVGDLVLAEDPTTGKVEPEPVQALIDDGVKPLM